MSVSPLVASIIGYVVLGLILGGMFVHYLDHTTGRTRFSYMRYGLSLVAMSAVIYALAQIDENFPNNLAYELIPLGTALLSCGVYVAIVLKLARNNESGSNDA
jgi:hypothetical protein